MGTIHHAKDDVSFKRISSPKFKAQNVFGKYILTYIKHHAKEWGWMLSGFAFRVCSEFAYRKPEPQQDNPTAKTTQVLMEFVGSGPSWINLAG